VILKSLDNDNWIKNGNIVIQLGEHLDVKDKFKNYKIMLSKIYQCAIELQESAIKTSSGLSSTLTTQNKDLIRPSILLLHLMRLFYAVCQEEDKNKLLEVIGVLEKDLNVKNRLVKPSLLPQLGPHLMADGGNGSSLAPVFDVATNLMKQVGLPVPDDVKAPTDGQIIDVLQTIKNNEAVVNLFQTVADSFKNNQDFASLATDFMQNMLKPEQMEGFKNSILKTAEVAKDASSN
jgi:hypothetical protein